MEKLKHMKEVLTDAVYSELKDIKKADTKELGEVIDMVKDLEEAIYYCTITKAMEAKEQYHPEEGKYYGGNSAPYVHGSGSHSSSRTYMPMGDYYYDYPRMEYNGGMKDSREGRSAMYRKTYMESKEMHKDKAVKMQELEKYMQELTRDMVEMIEDASPEERQLLHRKLATLSSKIENTNV